MTLLGDSYCEYNTNIARTLHESSIGSQDAASHRRLVADMSNRHFSLHEIQSKGPIVRDSEQLMIVQASFFSSEFLLHATRCGCVHGMLDAAQRPKGQPESATHFV
jgi:hypothetical protein